MNHLAGPGSFQNGEVEKEEVKYDEKDRQEIRKDLFVTTPLQPEEEVVEEACEGDEGERIEWRGHDFDQGERSEEEGEIPGKVREITKGQQKKSKEDQPLGQKDVIEKRGDEKVVESAHKGIYVSAA